MKFSFKSLLVLAAFAPFALASCSEKTQDNAEATAESAATDAANTTDAAGNAIENTADQAAAEMAPENGDTAVVRNVPADKLVEEVPAKQ
ncbi:entericidin EcnAB [Hymenobacter lapidiphilus]|uniref:entericidin EcnAB n=1 Tax=Hymenobacter sp. CCM 8763 TaxID=2303334 RepID=UPI000E343579|nr:entericidin EcnAB [Hymenobacter sp. CCM 8763]RFP66008.1 entericidin EcnAB [Hymenobacter sp. CCM 8763]